MLPALLIISTFSFVFIIAGVINISIHQEILMSALTDKTDALTAAVVANTAAVAAIPSASDVAKAEVAIDAATAQVTTNNQTLAGDVATA